MDRGSRKAGGAAGKSSLFGKRAFTLIELLIVIAVTAVLLSMLLPTLQKAGYLARRAGCLSNIVQQQVAQMSYAANWNGKFPPRIDCGADYLRVFADNTGPWYGLKKTGKYVQDSKILICPLLTHFGGIYADPAYYYPPWPDYGGWDADRTYVISAYAWFANYGHWSIFAPDEQAWPSNMAECDKNRAFISHRITYSPINGLFDDWGHLGCDRSGPNSGDFDTYSVVPDQPVGYRTLCTKPPQVRISCESYNDLGLHPEADTAQAADPRRKARQSAAEVRQVCETSFNSSSLFEHTASEV